MSEDLRADPFGFFFCVDRGDEPGVGIEGGREEEEEEEEEEEATVGLMRERTIRWVLGAVVDRRALFHVHTFEMFPLCLCFCKDRLFFCQSILKFLAFSPPCSWHKKSKTFDQVMLE